MLSIGKLSQIAQMQNYDVPTEKSVLDGNFVSSLLQAGLL